MGRAEMFPLMKSTPTEKKKTRSRAQRLVMKLQGNEVR